LSGQVLGLLTGVTAADHIRSGRLVPLLTKHVSDHASPFAYYGSRVAQPARVRAFIDHAISCLVDSRAYVLSPKELAVAEAKGRKALRIR
jgi:DNA-binding transcriptional LysR family regulator